MPLNKSHTYELHELQLKIVNGDETAFTHLYQHYYKKLFQFARVISRSKETAEELVEDVFVNLWSNRSRLSGIENLTVYLYVAVKNKSLNFLSARARELVTAPFDHLEITPGEFTVSPYDLLITSEMMQRMQEVIDTLPPRCKMIFRLVREDGLKYKEVAEILNISVNTIDVQMAIAVKRLCMALHVERPHKVNAHLVNRNN